MNSYDLIEQITTIIEENPDYEGGMDDDENGGWVNGDSDILLLHNIDNDETEVIYIDIHFKHKLFNFQIDVSIVGGDFEVFKDMMENTTQTFFTFQSAKNRIGGEEYLADNNIQEFKYKRVKKYEDVTTPIKNFLNLIEGEE